MSEIQPWVVTTLNPGWALPSIGLAAPPSLFPAKRRIQQDARPWFAMGPPAITVEFSKIKEAITNMNERIFSVVDALSAFGISHIDIPATAERIWNVIRTGPLPHAAD